MIQGFRGISFLILNFLQRKDVKIMRREYYDNFNEEYERDYRDSRKDVLKEGFREILKK